MQDKLKDVLLYTGMFFLMCLLVFVGFRYLEDRAYYFISVGILLIGSVPFIIQIERKNLRVRELVILAVMISLGVAASTAFFMVPQFKPVVAIVIISSIAFGSNSGFIVGAMTMLVSNFFFGQGPWTPWQMLAQGLIGYITGSIFEKRPGKLILSIYGFLVTFIIYGGIVNLASVMMFTNSITLERIMASYVSAIWFDLIHALATFTFLFIISNEMLDQLNRAKIKYGLLEGKI